ncbi:fimbria/pilus outer membrane usher protein, partial [Klebsiella pneumoniae]|uniref:fimbria/pilus outer membrane usher protein n=1 Tax=Klebsiella pneumoniae TaxID=573 RepID=UPI0013C32818
YSSFGLSLQGGATATLKGAALHRSSISGGTRMLLDTDGVPGIPVRGYSTPTLSNVFGKAAVVDVGSYYRNQFSIDLNTLPENAEVSQSVAQAT